MIVTNSDVREYCGLMPEKICCIRGVEEYKLDGGKIVLDLGIDLSDAVSSFGFSATPAGIRQTVYDEGNARIFGANYYGHEIPNILSTSEHFKELEEILNNIFLSDIQKADLSGLGNRNYTHYELKPKQIELGLPVIEVMYEDVGAEINQFCKKYAIFN